MQEPIISVSGLRGIIGESLSPELAMRFACAFVAGLPEGPIVLTRDGRTSGPMLAEALRAGIRAVGRDILDGDVTATPTTGVLVRQHKAAGGIQISASHNPPPYNGIKLFDAQGQVLSAAQGEQVVTRYRDGVVEWVDYTRLGNCMRCEDAHGRHAELVLATVDVARIRNRRFRVLLDSNGGAGSLLGRRLLEELGCQCTILGGDEIGDFKHPPEPTAENLQGVCQKVVDAGVDVGFCQDPDADRLAVIDENGRYIGEEFTLALCLEHVLKQRPGPVATNCSTSRMAQDLAEKQGVPFQRSAVGEANVVALMRATEATFGGEGNGGPIDPRVGYVRDSFVGMAQILEAMVARQCPVSQLADVLPQYAICKTKLPLEKHLLAAALDALEHAFPEAASDRLDGLRLDWPDRWLLVRASNTEPIVRAVAEAPGRDSAQSLCDRAATIIQAVS